MREKSRPHDGRRRPNPGKKHAPPFPLRQLLTLAVCRLSEPIAFMGIFPYIYFMIQDFHITEDESKISFYAGMVTSAFTFAEFIAGIFWGKLSDKIGRKPVILCGLAGTALSVLMFGFSPNLQTAVVARALGGLLNGNISVVQTCVNEIATHKPHQHRAYTVMPITWCIGSIIGPVIGGALARPCLFYPNIFPAGSIWDKYPYLLPNLFSGVAVFLSFVFGIFFLEETHSVAKLRRDRGLELGQKMVDWVMRRTTPSAKAKGKQRQQRRSVEEDEAEPLLDSDDLLPGYYATACPPPLVSMAGPSARHDESPRVQVYQERHESPESEGSRNSTAAKPVVKHLRANGNGFTRLFTKQVVLNIVSFGILAFHTMTFDQLLPVFLSTNLPEEGSETSLPFKFPGGFGMDNQTIGVIISFQGFYMIFMNTVVFPALSKWLGVANLFKLVAGSYFLLYLCTPYVALLPENLRMTGVVGLVIWKCTFSTMAYPTNAILIGNSSRNKLDMGTINGVAASTASLCRAFGPTLIGFLYAVGLETGYSGLAWWVTGVVAFVGAFVALPLEDTHQPAEEDEKNGDDDKSATEIEALLLCKGAEEV